MWFQLKCLEFSLTHLHRPARRYPASPLQDYENTLPGRALDLVLLQGLTEGFHKCILLFCPASRLCLGNVSYLQAFQVVPTNIKVQL